MTASLQNSAFHARDRTVIVLPAPPAPTKAALAARLAARNAAVRAARAAFAEAMELAMTTLILTGALLFGAGLLRYGVPPGATRAAALLVLYALAGLGGLATLVIGVVGLRHLIRGGLRYPAQGAYLGRG